MPERRNEGRAGCSAVAMLLAMGCAVGDEPDSPWSPPGLASHGSGGDEITTGEDHEPPAEGSSTTLPSADETTTDEPSGSTTETGCEGCVEQCLDGVDDDEDGDVDCDDADCEWHLACTCVPTPDEGFGAHVLCPEALPWDVARAACETSGMHLVSIESAAHNAWLVEQSQALVQSSWWMGYSDLGAEGVWTWVDGSAATFESWYPGEPNNGIAAPEHCAAFPEHVASAWNDLECSASRPFICEP